MKALQIYWKRLDTDYIDVEMIHYCDEQADFECVFQTEFIDYVKELKRRGTIRHIGISGHNPEETCCEMTSVRLESRLSRK